MSLPLCVLVYILPWNTCPFSSRPIWILAHDKHSDYGSKATLAIVWRLSFVLSTSQNVSWLPAVSQWPLIFWTFIASTMYANFISFDVFQKWSYIFFVHIYLVSLTSLCTIWGWILGLVSPLHVAQCLVRRGIVVMSVKYNHLRIAELYCSGIAHGVWHLENTCLL